MPTALGRSARYGGLLALAATLGLLLSSAQGLAAAERDPAYGPITLTASATPTAGPIPLTVAVQASVSGGFPPYSYNWSFGDGSINVTGPFANHTYRWAAEFRINVTATDTIGQLATQTFTVSATPAPLTIALSAVPSSLAAGSTTYLETSVSGGTYPYSYEWSGLPQGCPPQNVENLSCTPSYGGSYVVGVTVSDARGVTASASAALVVSGPGPPNATHSGPAPRDYTWDIAAVAFVGIAIVVAAAIVGIRLRRGRQGGSP